MASSSGSSNCSTKKPKIFRVDTELNVYCGHNLPAVRRVAGARSSREGHEFFGCPLWPDGDCKFFIWKDDVDQSLSGGTNYNQLIIKNQVLELKISNLKMEKALLEEENKNLKLKLSLANLPFKNIFIAVVAVILVAYYLNLY